MAAEILTFDNVSKRYGKNEVLRGVTLPIRSGQCVALTGRNGSGKTTLLRIAAGLTAATLGIVRRSPGTRTQYIPEAFPPLGISARSLLFSLGRIEGIPGAALDQKIPELLTAFGLDKESGSPLRTYSKGMLQKVSVIQAFLSSPDLLLLDEPLSGQDAQSQEVFLRKVRSYRANGTAIILACHEKHLISALADNVYEIREGTLAETEAAKEDGEDRYLFELPDGSFKLPCALAQPEIHTQRDGCLLHVSVPHGTGDRILKEMLDTGCRLKEMRYEKDC